MATCDDDNSFPQDNMLCPILDRGIDDVTYAINFRPAGGEEGPSLSSRMQFYGSDHHHAEPAETSHSDTELEGERNRTIPGDPASC